MSGSMKWFEYTTDLGQTFNIRLDESNTEAVNGATGDTGEPPASIFALPRNVKPRHLIYVSADGLYTRKIVALTPATYAAAPPNIAAAASVPALNLRRTRGESINAAFGFDTGLLDGDVT